MNLHGKTVLITGGAKRLGHAIALTLAQKGANVAISYQTSAVQAKQTVSEIEKFATSGLAIKADISKQRDVRNLIQQVNKRFKGLDVLINSAANFERIPFSELNETHWIKAMDTNLKGPFLCSLYAGKLMQKHGGGKIINFADWAAERPYKNYLPYCVSKAGVIGLTKTLAKELAPKIQVNAIAPGPILAPANMSPRQRRRVAQGVPLKRWGSTQDIANTVLFLIEGTDFMTGSTLFVDGGQLIA